MDDIFLEQVWSGNRALRPALDADQDAGGTGEAALLPDQQGPWDRLDHDAPFVTAAPSGPVPPKPPQANFYPLDVTKDEVEAWMKGLSGAAQGEATGFFSVVREGPGRQARLGALQHRVPERARAGCGALCERPRP